MRAISVLMCVLATFPACGDDQGAAAAAAARTFADFQNALQRRDESACRNLLTRDSAAALADMPWQHVAEQQPLQVLDVHAEGQAFHVQIADPNQGGRRSAFVVVREHGHLVVDLVATAGLCAEPIEATATRDQFAPRELSPADFDRIHEQRLSRPR